MSTAKYVVVAAPGRYVDVTRVLSAHATLEAAIPAARRAGTGAVVRESEGLRAGDRWLRVYEETCPVVWPIP